MESVKSVLFDLLTVKWVVHTVVLLTGMALSNAVLRIKKYLRTKDMANALGAHILKKKHASLAVVMSGMFLPRDETGWTRVLKKSNGEHTFSIKTQEAFKVTSVQDVEAMVEFAELRPKDMPLKLYFPLSIDAKFDTAEQVHIDNTTAICFGGPVSNIKTKQIFELLRNDPELKKKCAFDFEWKEDNVAENQIIVAKKRDGNERKEFRLENKKEYALVMRIPNIYPRCPKEVHPDYYIFIVAGITGYGTEAAGRYLRKYWEEFVHADPWDGIVLGLERKRPDTAYPEWPMKLTKKRKWFEKLRVG